jgi:hypothetical protein
MPMPCHWYINHDAVFSALSMPKEQEGCQIIQEDLQIRPFDKQGRLYPDNQYVALSCRYKVETEQDGQETFFFVASDSVQQKGQIRVNGVPVTPTPLDPAKDYSFLLRERSGIDSSYVYYRIKFAEQYTVPIRELNDVVYFQANLKKGENSIETQYEAALDRGGYDFLNDFSLRYLPAEGENENYPRTTVAMQIDNGLRLINTSMEKCLDKGENTYLWQATHKDMEQGLYWYFNKRLTSTEQFLLDIGPIGLGLVLISIVISVHLYYLRKRSYTFWDVVGIPFLFCILCNWMERFIRDFIGDHPPCARQDNIWLFLFLPLMSLVYWAILQIAKQVSCRMK